MSKPSVDTLETIDPEKQPLKKIVISKPIDYLKGSTISSSTIFFNLECKRWEEFIQLLEPIHRFDYTGKSPTMPISISIKQDDSVTVFTALSGMSWPTLLILSEINLDPMLINERKDFLTDCGYVVIEGNLSFFSIKGE